MSALDNLAPDQRAVLQMVLQRGRSYDEIAGLLAIDRGAVRQRALDAFDALTPATVHRGPERALVTDYLLGQLPDTVAERVHAYLQVSGSDREWAHALARVLEPLASGSLPEIPVGASLGADAGAAGGLEADSDSPPAAPAGPGEPPHVAPAASAEPREPRPSSRRGGAILLSTIAALIVAAVIVAIATSGAGKKAPHRPKQSGSTATATTATPQILAQLNLTSPTGAKSRLGIVQVIREGRVIGIVLAAQGMPANTTHNAYAVWLYNSPSSYRFVGFVQYLVGKSGKIDTSGKLKPGAAAYHHLLITLETQSKPQHPGEVVLSGPFREHP
jgi:hypothetical protein